MDAAPHPWQPTSYVAPQDPSVRASETRGNLHFCSLFFFLLAITQCKLGKVCFSHHWHAIKSVLVTGPVTHSQRTFCFLKAFPPKLLGLKIRYL